MDQTVLAALKKWPDVPDVYGWMELDLRGRYRLRTSSGEPARFESIGNTALNAFIGRNYQCDIGGRWFFQNGPQRAFVRLALTPWVYRLHGTNAPVTQTGLEASHVQGLVFYDLAMPVLLTDLGPGLVDDRDLPQLQALLTAANGSALDDMAFEQWLDAPADSQIRLAWSGNSLPVTSIEREQLGKRLGFDPEPRPPANPHLCGRGAAAAPANPQHPDAL
jgi:hypothetical protein